MRCEQIMKTDVVFTSASAPLLAAAQLMRSENVGFLPVLDEDGRATGAITDRDLVVRAAAYDKRPSELRVGEVMSRGAATVRPYDDVQVAMRVAREWKMARLIVTDDRGMLRGVLSLADITRHVPGARAAETLYELATRETQPRDGRRPS